ncbi:MAG: 3-oxoacyl-[acyl-carrier-protein] reductase FabG [Conexibacter sp.]|nr:3-oxoacyl-[acyl-carrier-protein] reductase FabG [Conexibacter sp.]
MSADTGRLAGKVVVISGLAGGQGREAALLFSREGARIVGCDLNAEGVHETEALVRAQGGEIECQAPVDLGDPAAADAWIAFAAEAFGGFDVLYNNAGAPRFGPIDQMSTEDWDFTIRNELDLVFYCTRAAWPHLVARGGGAIVNVGSVAGITGLKRMPQVAHAATKAAVIGLTRQLAAEGADHGIRANSLSPGLIESPATADLLAEGPGSPLVDLIGKTAMARTGRVEEMVQVALFLASDESSYVTGANIVADGGMTVII